MYDLGYTLVTRTTGFITRTFWPYRRTELKYMLDLLKDAEEKRILDYGCNTGYFTKMISQNCPDSDIYGADINEHAIWYARRKHKHLIFYEVNEEFFGDRRFDIIVISHVLEHIRERGEFVKNIAKILADDGRLIIAVPQERIRGDCTIFQIIYNIIRLRFENPHVAKLYYNDLEDLLEMIGFKIDDYIYTNYFFPFKTNSLRFHSWSLVVSASSK